MNPNSNIEKRPWGQFEVLLNEKKFKIKTITVLPGARLSYQSHKKRLENWVIVLGMAEVTLEDRIFNLRSGDHILIPTEAKHRIRNSGDGLLVFVEVQTGEYFGEDDIIRYHDDYNRI